MASKKPLSLYLGEVEGLATGDYVDITFGGTGAITKTAAFNNLSPTTTKGDLIVSDGANNIRIPIGTTGYVLTADSTQLSGLKWAASSGGSSGTAVIGVLKGDGTNIIQAVADTDYVTPNTLLESLQDIETQYKLADRNLDLTKKDGFSSTVPLALQTNLNGGFKWGDFLNSVSVSSGIFSTLNFSRNQSSLQIELATPYQTNGMIKAEGVNTGLMAIAIPGVDYAAPAQANPTGGATGQVLTKNSATNYDYSWITPSSSASGPVISSQVVLLGYDSANSRWKNTDTDTITITVTGAVVGKSVIITPSGVSPIDFTNIPADMALEMFACSAHVSATDTVTLTAVSLKGILRGYYVINILIG